MPRAKPPGRLANLQLGHPRQRHPAATSGHLRRAQQDTEGPRSSPPLVHRLAPIIDAGRDPLRTIRHKRREQIGELGVPPVLPRQPLHVMPLPSPARFADNCEDRAADIGQGDCAIAGHGGGRAYENETETQGSGVGWPHMPRQDCQRNPQEHGPLGIPPRTSLVVASFPAGQIPRLGPGAQQG